MESLGGPEVGFVPPMLDVPTLLELSRPRPRVNLLRYGFGLMAVLFVGSMIAAGQTPDLRTEIQAWAVLLLLMLLGAAMMSTMYTAKRRREQLGTVEAIEELIQLRRWEQAGMALQMFLSQPADSHRLRAEALIYLSSLLARYHRFADAISVQTYLLDSDLVDEATGFGLRLGRAMALLHEDRLVDADRAIGDLRRRGAEQSGGSALLEIYRDVKTGHPAEAIAMFEQKLPMMQQQLGHRVGDAHGLIAAAHDMLGQQEQAQAAYQRATTLGSAMELERRYPELGKLREKYTAAVMPSEEKGA